MLLKYLLGFTEGKDDVEMRVNIWRGLLEHVPVRNVELGLDNLEALSQQPTWDEHFVFFVSSFNIVFFKSFLTHWSVLGRVQYL